MFADGFILRGPARAKAVLWGFRFGFDTDDQEPQRSHICWPEGGPLCGSPHLWCASHEINLDSFGITCMGCVETWSRLDDVERLQANDLVALLASMGALASRLRRIEDAVRG